MIRPLGDRVAVEPLDMTEIVQKEHDGLLVLPESVAEVEGRWREFRLGRIVSTGPGKAILDDEGSPSGRFLPPPASIGELVVWRKFEGVETPVNGQTFVILKSEELMAVMEDFTL